jgi:hypothetical protein
MLKLVVVVLSILSLALSGPAINAANMEQFKKIAATVCGPNAAADKVQIAVDCEKRVPKAVSIRTILI